MQSLTKILLLTFCAKASALFWLFGSGSFDRCSSPFDKCDECQEAHPAR